MHAGIPSIAGMGLNPQPTVSIETADGTQSPTPWDQTSQLITASLQSINGTKISDVTQLLRGNLTADASSGVAHFTDLDVSRSGQGFKLQFSLASQWNVGLIFTGTFSIKAGPATLLSVAVQPATVGTTTKVLDLQPVIELIDTYGNFNPDAVRTLVTAIIRPDDPSIFLGWTDPELPGRTKGNIVASDRGRAVFTELALYGLGTWHVEFEAMLNFRTVSVEAANTIALNQLDSAAVKFILAVDFAEWSSSNEVALLETVAAICNLDVTALEVTDRSANKVGGRRLLSTGSTVAQVAIHVPDASPYFKMIANDISSESSALSRLGVYSVVGPGIKIENEPPPAPPATAAPEEYKGISFEMVDVWTSSVQALTIAGYLVLSTPCQVPALSRSLSPPISLPLSFWVCFPCLSPSLPPSLPLSLPHSCSQALNARTRSQTQRHFHRPVSCFPAFPFQPPSPQTTYVDVEHVAGRCLHGNFLRGGRIICSCRKGL